MEALILIVGSIAFGLYVKTVFVVAEHRLNVRKYQ